LVNSDPYEDGWLFKLNPSENSGLDDLLTAAEYSEFVAEEEE